MSATRTQEELFGEAKGRPLWAIAEELHVIHGVRMSPEVRKRIDELNGGR